MAKQTLKEGDLVRFNSEWVSQAEWDDVDMGEITRYENQIAKVVCLACYTELGEKDYEYYDIQFKDKNAFYAISGYHLTPIKHEIG